MIRFSTLYFSTTCALLLLLTALAIHAGHTSNKAVPLLQRMTAMVRTLNLTDLCLFTEASYTRHLAMTDLNTPFQDSPFSFEHFPTGALVIPPPHLMRANVDVN